MFNTDGKKHLNFVEDGRNECWLFLNYDFFFIRP